MAYDLTGQTLGEDIVNTLNTPPNLVPTVEPVWVGVSKAVLNYLQDNVANPWAVGSVYVQYTGTPDPATMYGGTWTDISASIAQSEKGGVYDSGSNANGSWIRFVDGTMECWGSISSATAANTIGNWFGTTSGTTFFSAQAIVFPQPFLSTPSVGVNGDSDSYMRLGTTAVGATVQMMQGSNVPTSGTWIAIGKWSATAVTASTFWQCTSLSGTTGNNNPTLIQSAIYDSGSNANGSWVRYTDGTMICMMSGTVLCNGAESNKFGSTAGSTFAGTTAVTFPQTFLSIPYFSDSARDGSSKGTIFGVSASSCSYQVKSDINGSVVSFSIITMGKWSSQSVPAPLGGITVAGIYDSGSNSNGNWIRFVDGTMECWGQTSNIVSNISGGASLFYGSVGVTFPQPFISTPAVTSQAATNSLGIVWGGFNNASALGITVYRLATNSGDTGFNYWHAVGKWAIGVQTSPNTYNITTIQTVVRAEYISVPTTTTGTILNFQNLVEDTNNAVTTGATWKFTCPVSGVYLVETNTYTVGTAGNTQIWKNGARWRYIGTSPSTATSGMTNCTIRLAVSDYIWLQNDSSASQPVDTNVWVSITLLGK